MASGSHTNTLDCCLSGLYTKALAVRAILLARDGADEQGMIRSLTIVLSTVIAAGVGAGAHQSRPSDQTAIDVPRVTQAEFRAKATANEVFVVDVRDDVAFKSGHIPGAVHAPATAIAERSDSIRRLAGTRLVVTYCSCAAEQSAAEAGLVLLQHGVAHVAALVGGYPDWIHGGGAAETGATAP